MNKPDPNLKAAMAEIMCILKQRDIAASVILSSVDSMEHLLEIEPTWACVSHEPAPLGGTLIRVKTTHLPDKETKQKTLEATVGMILGLLDVLALQTRNCQTLADCVSQHVGGIEHRTRRLQ